MNKKDLQYIQISIDKQNYAIIIDSQLHFKSIPNDDFSPKREIGFENTLKLQLSDILSKNSDIETTLNIIKERKLEYNKSLIDFNLVTETFESEDIYQDVKKQVLITYNGNDNQTCGFSMSNEIDVQMNFVFPHLLSSFIQISQIKGETKEDALAQMIFVTNFINTFVLNLTVNLRKYMLSNIQKEIASDIKTRWDKCKNYVLYTKTKDYSREELELVLSKYTQKQLAIIKPTSIIVPTPPRKI